MLRRLCRGVLTVLVTCAALLWPAASAVPTATAEESAQPPLLQSNWYWHKVATDAPVVVPDPGEPSNVPANDLPVASRDGKGTPSKVSVLAFSLPDSDPGTTVSAFTVTLTVDASATNVQPDATKLSAGLCLRNWTNGDTGDQDTVNAPPVDPGTLINGVFSSDGKTVSFSVPLMAQSWIDDANFGLEILPTPGYTTPFQVNFSTKLTTATMSYTPGAATPPTEPPTTPPVSSGTVPPPLTAGPPPLSTGSGLPSTSGYVPAPNVVPSSAATEPPQVSSTTPAAAQTALPEVSSRPAGELFWAGVALFALLVLVSIVLGGEPASAGSARPSRLTTVLRTRALSDPAR